jgi:hypothetical protein
LEIAIDKSETSTMVAGISTAPFEVGQRGRRGAVEGKVTVLIYEGEPLNTGSVTVGPLG